MARKRLTTTERMIEDFLSLPPTEAGLLLQLLIVAHRARTKPTVAEAPRRGRPRKIVAPEGSAS